MPALIEVRSHTIAPVELAALSQFAGGLDEGQLRDLLLALSDSLSAGFDLTLLDSSTEFTPQQAADRLRMSRTHLYKLLDTGAIPSHRVGRDRRITGPDLVVFERRRQAERRELAERFAHASTIDRAAIDELTDEL
jgi:excisionase family DNA binding protein